MNRIVFALLEILAAAVFLLPVYWLRFRDPGKIAASCVFSFYLVAVWSLVGLPTILYARFDINLNLIPFKGMIADAKNCLLNVALFGMTAKEWRDINPDKKGNIRDYATINELICLSNMENINAILISDGISQPERLRKLTQIAISQMKVLSETESRKLLK